MHTKKKKKKEHVRVHTHAHRGAEGFGDVLLKKQVSFASTITVHKKFSGISILTES